MNVRLILIFFILTSGQLIYGQSRLKNPSFEDEPADATAPQGWMPCDEKTTPDIFPGFWGVYNEPSHGNSYVGIITRENGTYESIGQRFSQPLKAKECYKSSIDLAHSKIYSGFNKPIKLRIYIGDTKCNRKQLIYESNEVKNSSWKTHSFKFIPDKSYEYILFEAFYKEGRHNHKGNILMDNIGLFIPCGNA